MCPMNAAESNGVSPVSSARSKSLTGIKSSITPIASLFDANIKAVHPSLVEAASGSEWGSNNSTHAGFPFCAANIKASHPAPSFAFASDQGSSSFTHSTELWEAANIRGVRPVRVVVLAPSCPSGVRSAHAKASGSARVAAARTLSAGVCWCSMESRESGMRNGEDTKIDDAAPEIQKEKEAKDMKNRRKSAKKIAEIAQPGDRVSLREMISGFGVAKGSVHFSRTHHFLMPALNIRFPRVVCAPFSQIQRLAHSAHAHHDDRAHCDHDAANRSGMRDLPVLEACEADMRPKSRGPKSICVQVLNFRVQSATHEHAKRRRAANNHSLHLRRFNPASLSDPPSHAFAPFLPG